MQSDTQNRVEDHIKRMKSIVIDCVAQTGFFLSPIKRTNRVDMIKQINVFIAQLEYLMYAFTKANACVWVRELLEIRFVWMKLATTKTKSLTIYMTGHRLSSVR